MEDQAINRFGRCNSCNGTGISDGKWMNAYCQCKFGRDLERETFRRLREEQSKRDELRLKMEAMGL